MKDEVNSWFGERFPEQSSLAPFSALWQVSFELRMIKIELASLWVLLIVLIVFTDFHHSSILLNNIFILEILIKNKHQMDFDH